MDNTLKTGPEHTSNQGDARPTAVRVGPIRRGWIAVLRFVKDERKTLIHTFIGVFLGSFLGAYLANVQSQSGARVAAATRLEGAHREAEVNFDTALTIKDTVRQTISEGATTLERIDLSMARAALNDERVFERLSPSTVSLLVEYIRVGDLTIGIHDRYNTLAFERSASTSGPVDPKLAELENLLRYNASVFAALSLSVQEDLANYFELDKLKSASYRSARDVGEKKLLDLTQKIIDGQYERPPRRPRVVPSNRSAHTPADHSSKAVTP